MRLIPLLFAASLLMGATFFTHAAENITPTQCGPGPAGSPCDGSGPASQGNTSETNQGAGNPINLITGNKYQREVDLPALPGVLGLEIVRHYNSVLAGPRTSSGILGRGWRLSYETDLNAIGNTLQIVQADGTRIIFIRDPKNPSQCASNNPANGTVTVQKTARGETYQWTWSNGRILNFNPQGKLIQIKALTGEFVSLTRDLAGVLVKVTDPQGRSLVLGYPAKRDPNRFNGVTHIDSPVGRFGYVYGNAAPKGYRGNPRDLLANLVRTSLPGQISRHYHYEDPAHATLLTGISIEGQGGARKNTQPQRLNTWAYDTQGRGILSVRGLPRQLGKDGKPVHGPSTRSGQAEGVEQVNLDFATPGKTLLTNSLGQQTVYTHAIVGNEYRLLDVRGAGCASCGQANVKYGYDTLGRLTETTQLSLDGKPIATTKTERDGQGRVVRESVVAWVNGKPSPAQPIARYDYAGESTQPVLIARPSVTPGREHQIRIAYNKLGQPTQIIESGFSPLDDNGQTSATPIVRTTTYAYRTLNGRSVLAQIDGPLKNGPKNSPEDSDVTRVEWDQAGRNILAMTQPGGAISQLGYDASGRIASVKDAQGFTTKATYNFRGQVLNTTSAGANWSESGIPSVSESYRYDASGNRVETGKGGTDGTDGTITRPQTLQAYDVAGRLLWQAEALGILKRANYDTEGNLLSSTVQTRSFEQTEQYRYDAFNRLIQVSDNTGSVRNVVYGNPSKAQRPSRQSAFQTRKDDFGRTVWIASASHGSTVRQYNAADQLIRQRNDKGDTQTYAYDLTGQRIRHTLAPKKGEATTTTWRHDQGRLIEAVDPVQTERIRYNERGQPASKTVSLKLANGAVATHVTRYTYTADGSLASQSLPDGTRIMYERNGQGQVVAVSQQTSPWTLFGWGKQTLVRNLERDLIGLRSITYGNGIQGQWQRSKQGVLARVVYTHPKGQATDPARVAAASQSAVKQPTLGSILSILLPEAHAQALPPTPSKLPGALGLPVDPHALFDARLLYDGAGNVLLQKQQGQGPQHTQAYAYDSRSQLVAAQTASRTPAIKTAASTSEASVWRYHYDQNGNRVLAQENVAVAEMGQTRKANYDPASNALITLPGVSRETVWNAQGQLVAIRQQNKNLAHYRYNHHGLRVSKQTGTETAHTLYNDERQRIADLDGAGRIIRQYLWLGDHLIATLDAAQAKPLQVPVEGLLAELTQTVQALWSSIAGNTDRLAFVHVNHLGAPVAATDSQGHTLWQADYAPYGAARITPATVRPEPVEGQGKRAAYTLTLRLPGQWEDEESGLHYNDFRYYDPQAGRYLSPDPLGRLAEALGSPNAYAYVNNNPLSYIDPWGLILFAFDGTGNSDPVLNPGDSLSNVVAFEKLYNDGSTRYITGVGTVDRSDPSRPITPAGYVPWYIPLSSTTADLGANYSGPARIDRMVEYFREEANQAADDAAMDVDIIGFSRGAAQARDFANRIVANTDPRGYYHYTDPETGNCMKQKVNFRFMGLWDTVLSTNLSGYGYKLAIPDEFQYVAQAVALNEHRGKTLRTLPGSTGAFPLESIVGGTIPAGQTRIERGFIGAHADIGGGFGVNESQLAQVALVWMVNQATAAGVSMNASSGTIIANPVIHDKSDNQYAPSGRPLNGKPEDRQVRYLDGTVTTQTQMTGTGMTWSDTGNFISYLPPGINGNGSITRTPRADFVTGTVDMQGYLNWLNANGYGLTNLTVQ